MFQREVMMTSYTCPHCGSKLKGERGLLRCDEHGMFSAYGSHLLVRVPSQTDKNAPTTMPWEVQESRRAR